jgi:protein TonB
MSKIVIDYHLPWDDDNNNIRNYRVILSVLIMATIIFSWLVASVILKEKNPRTRAEIPERFVKLVLEQKRKIVIPPPPPPKIVEAEKKEEVVKKEPEVKEIIKQKPKQKEIVKIEPKGNRDDAREKAKQNLAVFDVFADLRDADTSKKIANSSENSSDVGEAKTVTRDMIVNNAVKSSGGVKIAKASTNRGGAGLEGGGSRQVSSNLSAAKVKQSRSGNGGGLAERPAENIEKFMDSNKNSFFSLYNRALRKTPSMEGEVIFKLVILADGSVSEVSIVSSELNNPALERKLLTKIRSIRFTVMNVAAWKDNYRISFIPS